MLPWTRSRWFRRAVTGLSTAFVVAVLTTSLLAEGSALKRHPVHYASIHCPHGTAPGRSRPQGGCAGREIVVKQTGPKGDRKLRIDYGALARQLAHGPRLTRVGPRGANGRRGPAGRLGPTGARGRGGGRGVRGAQ